MPTLVLQLAHAQSKERFTQQCGVQALIPRSRGARTKVEGPAAQGHECPTLERLRIVEVDSVQLHAGQTRQHSHITDEIGNQSGIKWSAGPTQPAADEPAVDQHCVGQGHP
jgi:hypothetical protein